MPLQSSRTKSYGLHFSTYLRSSPLICHDSSSSSSYSYAFASSSSSFSSRSSTFFARATSPTRIFYKNKNNAVPSGSHHQRNRTCLCSPTTHPGSFRCSLHKGLPLSRKHENNRQPMTASFLPGSPLNLRRSAMKNSLVRIGGVEGELVKRALTALIRPSSHQQRRRAAFEPRPSRLSIMSKTDDS
ncbi:hypothetical protein ES319_A02G120200v1 [Gossypium barbadense]|uniref:Serine-rich protein-like protein n=1 Tax=Gossypium barbadense TaxID=3634 RepID=A0A5J5WP22_GOSBA|nr:hypothetical protein ES319_A02G120200v1 [Gossypium barbadense]